MATIHGWSSPSGRIMPRLVGRWTPGLGILGVQGLSAGHLVVRLGPNIPGNSCFVRDNHAGWRARRAGGMVCDIDPACGGALGTDLVDTSQVVKGGVSGEWDLCIILR